MVASKTELLYQGAVVYPRLVCIVADQPQERQFFALKGANSTRNCSLCNMKSAPSAGSQTPRTNSESILSRNILITAVKRQDQPVVRSARGEAKCFENRGISNIAITVQRSRHSAEERI